MKPFRCLFVALGSWRRKGLSLILDAFRLLPPGAFTLDVLGNPAKGEGPMLDVVRDLVQAGHIRPLGYRGDVATLYAQTDLLVVGSHYEAFSLVMLEALAHGLPIVTTEVNGAREAVEPGVNGFIVPRDPTAMAEAIRRIAADPAGHAAMRTAARARAAQFQPGRLATATEQVYFATLA
jgi:glycosyltransferase involved in cell wall biosynthesis